MKYFKETNKMNSNILNFINTLSIEGHTLQITKERDETRALANGGIVSIKVLTFGKFAKVVKEIVFAFDNDTGELQYMD